MMEISCIQAIKHRFIAMLLYFNFCFVIVFEFLFMKIIEERNNRLGKNIDTAT
jgi:hypothetical protein